MSVPDERDIWIAQRRERWRAQFFASWGMIGILILVAAVCLLAWRVRSAIAPFAIAAVFTFLLMSPVHWLEGRGVKRGWAIAGLFVAAALILVVAGYIVGPPLARQVTGFAQEAPTYVNDVQDFAEGLQTQYSQVQFPGWARQVIQGVIAGVGQFTLTFANSAASFVISAGSGAATALFDILLGVIIAFWILKDLPKLYEVSAEIAGPTLEDDLDHLVRTVRTTVGGYLRGQTIASAITGTIAGVGLAVAGVPYALLLAFLTYLFNYVPYIGPFVAGIIAAVIALFAGGWPLALWSIVVVVAAQQITDNFITPRIMSDQVDLHPTLVIFSLLVGGTLFGIVGMLVAIPLAATVKGLSVYYWERREHHPLSGPVDSECETAPVADGPAGS